MTADPARAREMALAMRASAPPPASCGTLAVAVLDQHYGLALDLARRGFTARQRENDEPLAYLLGIVTASTSPEQLQGAASLPRQYEGSEEEERAALLSALALSLKSAAANPRAHTATPLLAEEIQILRGSGPTRAWTRPGSSI